MRKSRVKISNAFFIQMIVMIMTDQNEIDPGKLVQWRWRALPSLNERIGTGEQ